MIWSCWYNKWFPEEIQVLTSSFKSLQFLEKNISSIKTIFSQLQHYWHFGPDISLLWSATQCIRGYLAPSLVPTHWMSLFTSSNPVLTSKNISATAAAKSFSRVWLCATPRRQPTRLPVPGILQARTLEWLAISFSNAWKWKMKVKLLSRVWLLATPWTAAYQAPPSMGFSWQEYWSGLPLLSLKNISRHY